MTVTSGGKSSVIHATQHHLFWDETSKRWVEADRLKAGEAFLSEDGSMVTVASTKVVPGAGNMWDLTVQDDHDFYIVAATAAVLVHNCPIGDEGTITHGSKTLYTERNGLYRVDIENPLGRDGQVHLQDTVGNKYIYDYEDDTWNPTKGSADMSNRFSDRVANDPQVQRALNQGAKMLFGTP